MKYGIRLAARADSDAILEIYAPYVRDTAVSSEIEVPSREEFAERVEKLSSHYPYLVYTADDKIVGYAYAGRHQERMGYKYDVNVSIYILQDFHGHGVAQALYKCLFKLLSELGYYNVYAGYSSENQKSRRFHEKCGFELFGTEYKSIYKLGKWHDVTWLQKSLKDHEIVPGKIKSIKELSPEFVSCVLSSVIGEQHG